MKQARSFSSVASNINLLWASVFIEELIRHGVTEFCIAPGSRSTPLTLAVANHPKATSHLHFDERGLGFLALGLCQSSQKPVVIITTSGTAVANLYPAVIEARQSGLPLIIISADRPADLIDCGANQAIDQHRLFANYPVFFAQIVQPTTSITINYLLTTVDQGLNKQQNQPAPIHFNIAFAAPLYPNDDRIDYSDYLSSLKKWRTNGLPFTKYIKQQHLALPEQHSLSDKKVLIILAKMRGAKHAKAVVQFSKEFNFPLLADIQSSQSSAANNLAYYDLLLTNDNFCHLLQQADIIIQFGEQLVSKRLLALIKDYDGERFLIHDSEKRIDENHQLDTRFYCTATQWIDAQRFKAVESDWFYTLQQSHQQFTNQIIEPFLAKQPFSEMTVIKQLDSLLIAGNPLFIGNSMPIRLADMFMNTSQAQIFTSRGASGIDGLLATAIGVAKKSQKTTTLLIGDTSFLYDLNSLALLKQLEIPFIIIVINNDGGAIFNLLPVPKKQKQRFYQLPHGLNFKASCDQFCIDYHNPNQLDDFKAVYNKCLQGKHSLIEITLENQQTAIQVGKLKDQISNVTYNNIEIINATS